MGQNSRASTRSIVSKLESLAGQGSLDDQFRDSLHQEIVDFFGSLRHDNKFSRQ